MDLLPLIAIPTIYFTVAFMKPIVQKKLPWNVCAVCIAVSATWLLLFVLWMLEVPVSELMIGILMGMSVAGLMYKAEPIYKRNRIKNFWFVRLLIIVGGFYSVDFLLQKQWGTFVLITITSLLLIIIATFLTQGVTHKDVVKEAAKEGKKVSLLKKLDDCC